MQYFNQINVIVMCFNQLQGDYDTQMVRDYNPWLLLDKTSREITA